LPGDLEISDTYPVWPMTAIFGERANTQMASLRQALADNPGPALVLGGLAIGAFYGVVARATNFCTLGAVSDWVNIGDSRRMRSWLMAIGVAMVGATLLEAWHVTDLSRSIYLGPRIDWAGALVGGAIFGFGMALAGGCPSRNLVRAGGGDLRALLTLVVLALFAEMTLGGVIAPMRVAMSDATMLSGGAATRQSIGDLLAEAMMWPAKATRYQMGLVAGTSFIVIACASGAFRKSRKHVFAGIGIGLAVIAAWALTGLAYDEMALVPERPQGLSFVAPTADAVEWLGRATATDRPSFAVATIGGVLLGSLLVAIATHTFSLTTFADTADTARHLAGAALMGVGGVAALGCSIGQGLSGLSTMAASSFIATAGIVIGCRAGLKALEKWA
jgi:uncharacterized membrane protein YedE/YeeE